MREYGEGITMIHLVIWLCPFAFEGGRVFLSFPFLGFFELVDFGWWGGGEGGRRKLSCLCKLQPKIQRYI